MLAPSVLDLHVPIIVLSPEAREGDGLAAEITQVDEAGGLCGAEGGHCHQQDLLPVLPCRHRRMSPHSHTGTGLGVLQVQDSPVSSLDWKRGALPQK